MATTDKPAKLTVELQDQELYQRVKQFAADRALPMREVVEQALRMWADEHDPMNRRSLYVHLASQIPEVQLIYQEGECGRICTAIDALPRQREYYHRVFDAEADAQRDGIGPLLEFRVFNVREHYDDADSLYNPNTGLELGLPLDSIILYQRKPGS